MKKSTTPQYIVRCKTPGGLPVCIPEYSIKGRDGIDSPSLTFLDTIYKFPSAVSFISFFVLTLFYPNNIFQISIISTLLCLFGFLKFFFVRGFITNLISTLYWIISKLMLNHLSIIILAIVHKNIYIVVAYIAIQILTFFARTYLLDVAYSIWFSKKHQCYFRFPDIILIKILYAYTPKKLSYPNFVSQIAYEVNSENENNK